LIDQLLQRDDPLDPGEVDPVLLAEPLDLAKEHHVTKAVAPPASRRPARLHQPDPVVLTQGLGVHSGHPGRDGDHQHLRIGRLGRKLLIHREPPPWAYSLRRARASRCSRGAGGVWAANRSSACLASSDTFFGTTTSTVTSRSPARPSRRTTPRPRARRV